MTGSLLKLEASGSLLDASLVIVWTLGPELPSVESIVFKEVLVTVAWPFPSLDAFAFSSDFVVEAIVLTVELVGSSDEVIDDDEVQVTAVATLLVNVSTDDTVDIVDVVDEPESGPQCELIEEEVDASSTGDLLVVTSVVTFTFEVETEVKSLLVVGGGGGGFSVLIVVVVAVVVVVVVDAEDDADDDDVDEEEECGRVVCVSLMSQPASHLESFVSIDACSLVEVLVIGDSLSLMVSQ